MATATKCKHFPLHADSFIMTTIVLVQCYFNMDYADFLHKKSYASVSVVNKRTVAV